MGKRCNTCKPCVVLRFFFLGLTLAKSPFHILRCHAGQSSHHEGLRAFDRPSALQIHERSHTVTIFIELLPLYLVLMCCAFHFFVFQKQGERRKFAHALYQIAVALTSSICVDSFSLPLERLRETFHHPCE
jgi:hypothetical protein